MNYSRIFFFFIFLAKPIFCSEDTKHSLSKFRNGGPCKTETSYYNKLLVSLNIDLLLADDINIDKVLDAISILKKSAKNRESLLDNEEFTDTLTDTQLILTASYILEPKKNSIKLIGKPKQSEKQNAQKKSVKPIKQLQPESPGRDSL